MQWKENSPLYRFLMVWCWGTILFYTVMATKYVTYTYIAIVPAMILAAFSAPKIRMGEKVPAILGGIGLFLLLCKRRKLVDFLHRFSLCCICLPPSL